MNALPDSQEAWLEDLETCFNELCCDNGIDPGAYEFHIANTPGADGFRRRSLLVRGALRTSDQRQIDDVICKGWYTERHMQIPAYYTIRDKYPGNKKSIEKIEKRISKTIACVVLLGTGIKYEPGAFPLVENKGWFFYSVNAKKADPDYSFLADLDLHSEEDCLAGLLYFSSIVVQNTMNPLSAFYSQKELIERCRRIASSIGTDQAGNIDMTKRDICDYGENILWGISLDVPLFSQHRAFEASVTSYSAYEWKETNKLVRFLNSDEDGTLYEDYEVDDSFISAKENIQAKIKKKSLKKLVSAKMVSEILKGKTRTKIMDDVISVFNWYPLEISVNDLISAIRHKEKNKEDVPNTLKSQYRSNSILSVMKNIVKCLTIMDEKLDPDDMSDALLLKKTVNRASNLFHHMSSDSHAHPLVPLSEMLIVYMGKNPRDINVFMNILLLGIGSEPKVFNGKVYEKFLLINDLRQGMGDEDTIVFLTDACRYHLKDVEKRPIKKADWQTIVEKPEEFKNMPYEWVYGVFSNKDAD